jgi:hypothetical protein
MNSSSTTGRRTRLAAAIVGAPLVAALLAGSVLGHGPDPIVGGALWAQNQLVEYDWRSGQVPPDWMRAAINAAAADSNTSRASRAAQLAFDAEGTSRISYGEPSGCGVNGLACFNRSGAPDSFTVAFRRQGYVFEWGTLRWCQAYDDPPNGCFDVENVTLDEFGHVQVLGHHDNRDDGSDYLDAVVQTLSHAKPGIGWDEHDYGRCDVATLQLRYDMRSWAAPYSTCLDLDTRLALAVSDSSVPPGALVIFRAGLEVVDADAYLRLGGNPVSARSVVLQRRPIGGTTWTNVATMAPDATAGSYALGLTLTASAEWRASFPTPTSEGLNGDASNRITVQVGGACTSGCPSGGGSAARPAATTRGGR